MTAADLDACPCGRGGPYASCCGRVHRDLAAAERAEDVMRARYSAYVLGLEPFLLASWHPTTRPPYLGLDDGLRWTGLSVVATVAGGALDATGEVSFIARFERRGAPGALVERSRFERTLAGWVYVDGTVA